MLSASVTCQRRCPINYVHRNFQFSVTECVDDDDDDV